MKKMEGNTVEGEKRQHFQILKENIFIFLKG